MAEVIPMNGGSLTNAARNARVVEILDRKDAIETERQEYREQIVALDEEQARLEDELAELTGTVRQLSLPAVNGTRGKRTCKFQLPDGTICGSHDHDSRFHKEV